jgi:endonuclease/exonuclease/phosphatase family metal-dependent hydrolase
MPYALCAMRMNGITHQNRSSRRPFQASAHRWQVARVACVVGFWVCAAVASAHAEEPGTPLTPARPLRFVTFNLFHGGAFSGLNGEVRDLGSRLEAVVEELRRLNVDVIGLQEASTGRERGNVAERLAARLGYHVVYAPSNPRIFADGWFGRTIAALLNFTEGPAIVSRFPVLEWNAHELPACGRFFARRTVLSATLDTPMGLLRVFSAHTLGDPCQTLPVADLVREGRGLLPAVLMGDFNAVEDSPAIAAFTTQTGFIDAFRVANPNQPGFTVWQRITESTPTVRRRVDYLFLVPADTVQTRVRSSRLILNKPRVLPNGSPLWPSDHYGVLADLEISGSSETASSIR